VGEPESLPRVPDRCSLPAPVAHLGQILAVFVDVPFVLDQLVLQLLLQVWPWNANLMGLS